MRIGILSDTHGGYRDFLKALELMGPVDCYLHLVDVLYHGPRNDLPGTYDPKALAAHLKEMDNIYFVKGNCDSEVDEMVTGHDISQNYRVLDLGGMRFFLTHGHREHECDRIKMAEDKFADFLITGHTHVKVNQKTETLHILNPGSTTIPKDGSHSCMVIEDGNVKVLEW